jgi:hypothetical protein
MVPLTAYALSYCATIGGANEQKIEIVEGSNLFHDIDRIAMFDLNTDHRFIIRTPQILGRGNESIASINAGTIRSQRSPRGWNSPQRTTLAASSNERTIDAIRPSVPASMNCA